MTPCTGRGDKGETDLMGGPRVSKDHYRVEAIGEVDELNAALGVVVALLPQGEISEFLTDVQNDLFTVGAELSLPPESRPVKEFTPLPEERVEKLERAVGAIDTEVEPRRVFVLPGGSREAALLHYARAVTRRAERRVVALAQRETVNPAVLSYLNRLSSLLFAMALKVNRDEGVEEKNPTYP